MTENPKFDGYQLGDTAQLTGTVVTVKDTYTGEIVLGVEVGAGQVGCYYPPVIQEWVVIDRELPVEPLVGSVVRDKNGDLWARIVTSYFNCHSVWVFCNDSQRESDWDWLNKEYGPLETVFSSVCTCAEED